MFAIFPSVIIFLILGLFFQYDEDVFFQSNGLKNINLIYQNEDFFIRDDFGNKVKVSYYKDSTGIIYWYRRLKTPVCLTGECKLIDIGIYWHFNGDFFGLEVYDEHLTKTDHSLFSSKDYDKLMSVLSNNWSILREYEPEGLLDENYEEIDATSGATKKEIANETVEGAVYTTYTIWHLIHQGEKEQLTLLSLNQLNDPQIMLDFLSCNKKHVQYFLLDQFNSGNLKASSILEKEILGSLNSTDLYKKNLAFQSLKRIDFNSEFLQKELAVIYNSSALVEKQKIVSALSDVHFVVEALYNVLAQDLSIEKEWFSSELLSILKRSSKQNDEVVKIAQHLAESKNSYVSNAAREFLRSLNQ